jgi:hypothetical protein
LRSIRSEPSALVRGHARGVEHERSPEPRGELSDAAQRVGVLERALELGVDDRVELARLVAAGVADGLLAFGGRSSRRRTR